MPEDYRKTRSRETDAQEDLAARAQARQKRRKKRLHRLARLLCMLTVAAAGCAAGWAALGPVRLSAAADAVRLVGRWGGGFPLEEAAAAGVRQAAPLGASSLALLGPTQLDIYTASGYNALSFAQPYASPALCCAGGRALLYDRGSGKFTLLSQTGKLWEQELERRLSCVDLSGQGCVAAAAESARAASELFVWDAKQRRRFAWRCEKEYPSALRLRGADTLAACLIGTEQAGVYSRFAVFDTRKPDAPATDLRLDGVWLYGCVPAGGAWLLAGDQAAYLVKDGAVAETYGYGGRALELWAAQEGAWSALALADWDNHWLLRVYDSGGRPVLEQSLPQRPAALDCREGKVYLRFEPAGSQGAYLLRWQQKQGFQQSQTLPAGALEAFVTGGEAYVLTARSVERLKLDWAPAAGL